MEFHKFTHAYLDSVCRKIHPRSERELFRAELADHIEQKTLSLVRSGLTQGAAEREALKSLGNAETLSREMGKVHRPAAVKYIFLALTLFLAFLNVAPWLAFLFNIPNMPLAVFPVEGNTAIIGGADGPTQIYMTSEAWSISSFLLPMLLLVFACITVWLFLRSKFNGNNKDMRPRT